MAEPILSTAELLGNRRRILVTGGAGFIGGAVIRRLLRESNAIVFNLDKLGYASDLTSSEEVLSDLGEATTIDTDFSELTSKMQRRWDAVREADPDLVMHLPPKVMLTALSCPWRIHYEQCFGTYNLLQAVRRHVEQLTKERYAEFRMHHISTDEVFGSLGPEGRFSETTCYDPRSPYSASKAASDHLVQAWHHTFGLPIVITNCSNNYGPWQFPEKLIPVVILKALSKDSIPLYGDGLNVRDWLYVEDHVDALLLAACRGESGRSYCIGGHGEKTNKEIVEAICHLVDGYQPQNAPHADLITRVTDRPGHDRRYAINSSRISEELGWKPRHNLERGLAATVSWYLDHQNWCFNVRERACYDGGRLGMI